LTQTDPVTITHEKSSWASRRPWNTKSKATQKGTSLVLDVERAKRAASRPAAIQIVSQLLNAGSDEQDEQDEQPQDEQDEQPQFEQPKTKFFFFRPFIPGRTVHDCTGGSAAAILPDYIPSVNAGSTQMFH
jgi:hypothetical protein